MNIWIFRTGEPLHIDTSNSRPMRAMNLADSLIKAGHSVTLWSSDFFHQEKRSRTGGYKEIKVVTQLQNKSGCRLYEKCNFQIESITNIYHFWQ